MESSAAWVDGCAEVLTMTTTSERPVVESRARHHLAADAFLYAAFIVLVGFGLQELLWYLISGGDSSVVVPPVWLQLIGALAMPVAVIGGPLLAWWVHGRRFGWRELLAGGVGAVVGGALLSAAFAVLFVVLRLIPSFYPRDDGPWDVVVIATVAVVAFLAQPVIAAVRDLAGAKRHPVRDGLRLGILAIGLAAVVVSVMAGGESAELGLFLALPAAPAACAAVAADMWQSRHNRAGTQGPTAS
jgi:hypothetical protein